MHLYMDQYRQPGACRQRMSLVCDGAGTLGPAYLRTTWEAGRSGRRLGVGPRQVHTHGGPCVGRPTCESV